LDSEFKKELIAGCHSRLDRCKWIMDGGSKQARNRPPRPPRPSRVRWLSPDECVTVDQLRNSRSPTCPRSRGMDVHCYRRTCPAPNKHFATLAEPGHIRSLMPKCLSRCDLVISLNSRWADLPYHPRLCDIFFSTYRLAHPRRGGKPEFKLERYPPLDGASCSARVRCRMMHRESL
jgi:hypothetical protein